MIKSWYNKQTRLIWEGKQSRKLPLIIQNRALRKLRMLDAALRLEDLRIPPGNRLEPFKKGHDVWNISINNRWRIQFRWHKNDAYEVHVVRCSK